MIKWLGLLIRLIVLKMWSKKSVRRSFLGISRRQSPVENDRRTEIFLCSRSTIQLIKRPRSFIISCLRISRYHDIEADIRRREEKFIEKLDFWFESRSRYSESELDDPIIADNSRKFSYIHGDEGFDFFFYKFCDQSCVRTDTDRDTDINKPSSITQSHINFAFIFKTLAGMNADLTV